MLFYEGFTMEPYKKNWCEELLRYLKNPNRQSFNNNKTYYVYEYGLALIIYVILNGIRNCYIL